MNLTCKPLMNGIMAYWNEVPDAARYNIYLFINEQKISTRTNDRSEMYCSFMGLAAIDGLTKSMLFGAAASIDTGVVYCGVGSSGSYSGPKHSGLDYYVQVEAENRNGEIIDGSAKVKCAVKEF